MKKFLWSVTGIVFLFAPQFSSAACATSNNGTSLNNPSCFPNIQNFVAGILQIFVVIGVPIIGFFIVLAGFNFITARGNPTKLNAAKQNFLYVIIGTVLVLGAWVLANLISATVSQVTGTSLL